MLQRKARPKRKRIINLLSTIATESKDCSNNNNNLYKVLNKLSSLLLDIKYTSISNKFNNKLGLTLLNSIPVLSIFVLLGIITYSTIGLPLGEPDGEVYAAESTSSTSSLIIDNGNATDSTATVRNGVAYSSHTVQVKADNITGYTLSITGPASLSNGSTTIGGAGGKQGSSLGDNTWGYGWNTTTTADANMTYNSFTGSAQTLEANSSATSANFTKKLVFAAKFNQNAAEGHYRANVKLNLAVTPKTVTTYNFSVTYNLNGGSDETSEFFDRAINPQHGASSYKYTIPTTLPIKAGYRLLGYSSDNTTSVHYAPGNSMTLTTTRPTITLSAIWRPIITNWNNLVYMQDMTPEACASASIGAEKTLTDTRDNNASSYLVRKLADGNCWLTTNLTLDLGKSGVATVNESDNLSDNYPSEALINRWNTASTNAWQDSDKTLAQFSKAPQKQGSGGEPYQSSYGYYYSFKAATAATIADDAESGNAPGSICPLGWNLPRTYTPNDFQTLYDKNTSAASWTTENGLNGRWLGAASANAGGAFFPAAGYVSSSGFRDGDTIGYYRSRSVVQANNAPFMYFNKQNFYAAYNNQYQVYKSLGYSVRCIAYSS